MREAAASHSPQPAPEGRSNHLNRSVEAWLCQPKPYEGLPRLAASAQCSGKHRCARRTSRQR
eukprot:3355379-Prymnesium_polylepis.1